jgi:hypothetical protein
MLSTPGEAKLRRRWYSYRLSRVDGVGLLALPLLLGDAELEESGEGLGEVLEEGLLVLGVLLDDGLELGVGAACELKRKQDGSSTYTSDMSVGSIIRDLVFLSSYLLVSCCS